MIFLREFKPVSDGNVFTCGYFNCNTQSIKEVNIKMHLKKHLLDENIQDSTHEEAFQKIVRYIKDNIGYTLSQKEIQEIMRQREVNKQRGIKRRKAAEKEKSQAIKVPQPSKKNIKRKWKSCHCFIFHIF